MHMAEEPVVSDPGPGIDWYRAQPYGDWAQARRSECPVISTKAVSMGPGTTFQLKLLALRAAVT
jgi:hypothetical protein